MTNVTGRDGLRLPRDKNVTPNVTFSGDQIERRLSQRVDDFIELHMGGTFDIRTIRQECQIETDKAYHALIAKLGREVQAGKLEKSRGIYRVLDNTITLIDWVHADEQEHLPVRWPFGREDETQFAFDGHVFVSPGDLVVIAGVSNMGKTAWCLNFLWENMDAFPCTLMGNEYQGSKFKRRVSWMDWAEPLNEHGAPKFELIERYDGWKDAIQPDNINIIDWINLDDKFYMIGAILQGIRSKLRKGMAVVALQKSAGKEMGMGGGFSEHLASLYLTLDFERMTVKKAKEWDGVNPNGLMDRFKIVSHGAKFDDIHRIILCPECRGYAAIKKNPKCQCKGVGYVDYESAQNIAGVL